MFRQEFCSVSKARLTCSCHLGFTGGALGTCQCLPLRKGYSCPTKIAHIHKIFYEHLFYLRYRCTPSSSDQKSVTKQAPSEPTHLEAGVWGWGVSMESKLCCSVISSPEATVRDKAEKEVIRLGEKRSI